MGGLILLLSILLPTILFTDITNIFIILAVFTTLSLGCVGLLDDYLKVVKKMEKGLIGRYKLIGQITVGIIVGSVIYF